ncbi:hypothetical protein TsFJ059_008060 [Trichoderma semiorbis]|uniref:Fungal STAND N-terminal Goodbye domain-containing protein n=1 Tax=Trichoderma semiorbis TaxID=1491008 RepID=A0A9P8H9L7_9HYPO|nr:hypothetical protein TsFJ059_008060 [Trichoderma semiorbis]
MASNGEEKKIVPEDLESDNRDVADLWKQALKQYKGIVGFDLQPKFNNVQAMIDFGTNEMNSFHKFRHNSKKVDKLRSLFAANIDYIEKGAQQLISAAVPAFPPAAAIGTAITYLLSACKQVSADYDVVVVFFDDMNSFLERVVILETRLPSHKAYQNCLMDVFTSFLTLTGYAHKYIELGRFKKWITNLIGGEDSDLGGARKKMDKDLTRLQNATEFAILGNSEELKKMNTELQNNQEAHTRMLEEQKEMMFSISQDTGSIRSDVAKLLKAFTEQNAKHDHKGKPSTQDAGKPASANRVRNRMPDVEGDGHEYAILKETLIPDTCTWVFSQQEWEDWVKQGEDVSVLKPVLALAGLPGTGKSHLAAAVHDKLYDLAKKDSSQRTCVAHFYFREQRKDLSLFRSGLITTINQIVEQSVPLCERINAEMVRDEVFYNVFEWRDLLLKILGPSFSNDSPNRLFVLFDGLDELIDFPQFLEFVKLVRQEKFRISIVVTSRPDLLQKLSEQAEVSTIEVTKEKQLQDFKTLAWHRINDLNYLKKFTRYVQQRIAEKVEVASPNLLYAEHTLERLNALGREGAALQVLAQPMPENLHGVYEIMLDECQRRMPADRQQIAAKLLHWIAFSYRVLTLDEVTSLLVYLSKDDSFTLEEIPEVASKFLQIGDPAFEAQTREIAHRDTSTGSIEDLEKAEAASDNQDDVYNDGALPVKFKERSMRAFFRDASDVDSKWHLKASEAHRQIFLAGVDLVKPEPLGPGHPIKEGLRLYAAYRLLSHFVELKLEEHTPQEKAEVMEGLAMALSHTDFADTLSRTGMTYNRGVKSLVNDRVALWAESLKIPEISPLLSPDAAAWWADVAIDSRRCRYGMVRGYVSRIYTAANLEEVLSAYKLLYGLLGVSGLDELLVDKAKANFPDEASAPAPSSDDPPTDDSGNAANQATGELGEEKSSLGLPGIFSDLEMDGTAYRAVGELFFHYSHYKAADLMCKKAYDICHSGDDNVEKFKISILHSKVLLKLHEKDKAFETILERVKDIETVDVPTALKRAALLAKAEVETKLKMRQAAAESYTKAKSIDPTGMTTGDALVKEIELFEKVDDYAGYFRTLKSWSPIDRLTWMAWNYCYDGRERHDTLRSLAIKEGEAEFLIEIYKNAIQFLDRLNSGAPLRLELAVTYFRAAGDLENARKYLDDIFNTTSGGYPYSITDEQPQTMLQRAVDVMSDVLYEIFRSSRDPKVKLEALEALKGLMDRPLSLSVPIYTALDLVHRRIVIASMCLKMGQGSEFQERLQSVFNDCFAGLSDKVSWNDGQNLEKLGHALMILSKAVPDGQDIQRYARIVISAMFSKITTASEEEDGLSSESDESGDEESDSSDDEDDTPPEGVVFLARAGRVGTFEGMAAFETMNSLRSGNKSSPKDEGDLGNPDIVVYSCDGGICTPTAGYAWWGDSVVHYCAECSTTLICEICYNARHTPEKVGSPNVMHFCDKRHNYIKLPVEGWRGIKDGVMRVDGEEPVKFESFLNRLQNEICTDAWDRFWTGA